MKFLHLAVLHLGKRVNGFSMLEDQAYILRQILTILDDARPDGVLIAGDVYDKPVPPTVAVELLNGFLTELCTRWPQWPTAPCPARKRSCSRLTSRPPASTASSGA